MKQTGHHRTICLLLAIVACERAGRRSLHKGTTSVASLNEKQA